MPKPTKVSPKDRIMTVGRIEPAGARVLPPAEATFCGTDPIVRVKETVWEADVTVTTLSPVKSVAGVHDQLPEASAVAERV